MIQNFPDYELVRQRKKQELKEHYAGLALQSLIRRAPMYQYHVQSIVDLAAKYAELLATAMTTDEKDPE